MRTQERRTQQGSSDPQEPSQSTHSTAARQHIEVRTSVEEEMAQLERQEEELHDALDGSEDDVFGHGVSWEGEETEARETQERIQPPTKLQTLERTPKRLAQQMMERMGWIPGTALGSIAGPAPSPLQASKRRIGRPLRARIGTEPWNLVSPMFEGMWDVVLRKSDAWMQSPWQC